MAAYGCKFQPLFGCCALQMLISFNKSLEVTFKLKQAIDIDMLYEKQFFEFKINVVSIGALLVFFHACIISNLHKIYYKIVTYCFDSLAIRLRSEDLTHFPIQTILIKSSVYISMLNCTMNQSRKWSLFGIVGIYSIGTFST